MDRTFSTKREVVVDILVECVKQGVLARDVASAMAEVGSRLNIDVFSGLFEQMKKVVKYRLEGVGYYYDEKRNVWEKRNRK